MAGNQAPDLRPGSEPDAAPEARPELPETRSGSASAAAAAGTRAASRDEARGRRPRRVLVIALAVALGLTLILLFGQVQKTRSLEDRVAGLEGELASARARLGAYDRHLEAVKELVGGLSTQLRALEGLVEAGPEGAAGHVAPLGAGTEAPPPGDGPGDASLGEQSGPPAGE